MDKFGLDFGLINQAMLMGRKVGAFKQFWASLAHYRVAFEVIVGLPAHIALMQDKRLLNVIPDDKTAELLEWIDSLDPGSTCLLDICPKPEILGFEHEGNSHQANSSEDEWRLAEFYQEFFRQLIEKISDMGIDPWELTTLPNSLFIENESKKGTICFRPNIMDAFISEFVREIKTIIIQRQFISAFLQNQR
ncbi:MAG: hypothetical protein PF572_06275 [Patescibacteria group bacterium]|jgi:hypothetical protein|nr:hypothetical protein [Patescibacteria group bacterium]